MFGFPMISAMRLLILFSTGPAVPNCPNPALSAGSGSSTASSIAGKSAMAVSMNIIARLPGISGWSIGRLRPLSTIRSSIHTKATAGFARISSGREVFIIGCNWHVYCLLKINSLVRDICLEKNPRTRLDKSMCHFLLYQAKK